jgi:hypothetical protein
VTLLEEAQLAPLSVGEAIARFVTSDTPKFSTHTPSEIRVTHACLKKAWRRGRGVWPSHCETTSSCERPAARAASWLEQSTSVHFLMDDVKRRLSVDHPDGSGTFIHEPFDELATSRGVVSNLHASSSLQS